MNKRKIKHQIGIITPSKISSAISQIYGYYDLGSILVLTFISKPL